MNLIPVFFFSCLCTVESFVTAKTQTATQAELQIFSRLRDFTKLIAAENGTVHDGSDRAKIAVRSMEDAWEKHVGADLRRETQKERGEFKFDTWKDDVVAWTKDARRKVLTRFQEGKSTENSNKTIAKKTKESSFFKKFMNGQMAVSSKSKEAVLIAGSLLDLMMILLTSIDPLAPWVPNVNIALWWIMGIIVQMVEGDLNFIDAAFVCMQIDSTIGYGSNCPSTNGWKLYTALHIFLGTMFVSPQMNGYLEALFDKFDGVMFPFNSDTPAGIYFVDLMFACLAITGVTTLHALVDGTGATDDWIDGLYMCVASFQTTGYGDIAPNSPLTRALSVIWGTLGSRFYGSHVADAAGRYFAAEHLRRFGVPAPPIEELPDAESRATSRSAIESIKEIMNNR